MKEIIVFSTVNYTELRGYRIKHGLEIPPNPVC